jgi:hypothetical protein
VGEEQEEAKVYLWVVLVGPRRVGGGLPAVSRSSGEVQGVGGGGPVREGGGGRAGRLWWEVGELTGGSIWWRETGGGSSTVRSSSAAPIAGGCVAQAR